MDKKLQGHTEPRFYTPPLTKLTEETTLGYEAIDFAENFLGITLHPWQKWLFLHALELDPETNYQDYRFRQILVLVGRQNGKTVAMTVLGLWRMFMDGASEIISTAQNLRVAEDTLKDAFNIAQKNPSLRKYFPHRNEGGKHVPWMRQTNGSHQIELASIPPGLENTLDVGGAMPTWYVVAANGGGRSYSADLALFDELREHKDEGAWNSIAPTTVERPRSQIWAFSNAGDARSVVLRRLRNVALAAINEKTTDEERLGLFEWSADPDLSIFDEKGWAQANPSLGYGHRTARDMKALAKQTVDPENGDSTEAGFRTEYLCQWVETLEPGKISKELWDSLADPQSAPAEDSAVFVGIDVAQDGAEAHIAIGAYRTDGLWHTEIVASRLGYKWVQEWLETRLDTTWFTGEVGIQVKGSASAHLASLLEESPITIIPWQGVDMSSSVLGFFDLLRAKNLRHRNQNKLDLAVDGIKEKKAGDTWIWDRQNSLHDATPLIAANIAWWMGHRKQEAQFVSAYDDESFEDFFDLDDEALYR